MALPGIYVSATRKSSGKTTLSAGLSAAISARSHVVQGFKKGPDYIDPMWLRRMSGRPCYNLDFHTQSKAEILSLYQDRSASAKFSIVEGNKGLFDGVDLHGSDSNAAMATLLGLPVLLIVDAQGMTRGVAPLVNGYLSFEKNLQIEGVILNNLGGPRHESKCRQAIEHYTDATVIGAMQRDASLSINERHLGLVTDREDKELARHTQSIQQAVEQQVDIDAVLAIGETAKPMLESPTVISTAGRGLPPAPTAVTRLGVARDDAFCFYYADDLEALEAHGAKISFFDTLRDQRLPEVDGLFIGGGFPETHAVELEANSSMRAAIRQFSASGRPVYAECGGLMYLSRTLSWKGKRHEMTGVIPADCEMTDRPVGRGYVRLDRQAAHPWGPPSSSNEASQRDIPAHEFHYSRLVDINPDVAFGYSVSRGYGIDGKHDGLIFANVFATYSHMRHTEANPWVSEFMNTVAKSTRHAA